MGGISEKLTCLPESQANQNRKLVASTLKKNGNK